MLAKKGRDTSTPGLQKFRTRQTKLGNEISVSDTEIKTRSRIKPWPPEKSETNGRMVVKQEAVGDVVGT
jgi:hypothetical protein